LWFDSTAGVRGFSLSPKKVQNGFGAHSSSYSIAPETLSPSIQRLRHEDDNSPLSSSKVKNEMSYTCASPYAMELNTTEIYSCCEIRFVEFIHNTSQAHLCPQYNMMIRK
jgi:hypothetical protein